MILLMLFEICTLGTTILKKKKNTDRLARKPDQFTGISTKI